MTWRMNGQTQGEFVHCWRRAISTTTTIWRFLLTGIAIQAFRKVWEASIVFSLDALYRFQVRELGLRAYTKLSTIDSTASQTQTKLTLIAILRNSHLTRAKYHSLALLAIRAVFVYAERSAEHRMRVYAVLFVQSILRFLEWGRRCRL